MNRCKSINLPVGCLVSVLLLSSIWGGGCATQKPVILVPGSNQRLEDLSDTYFMINKYYVDPVTPSQLSASAVRGMEEFAASKKSVLQKHVTTSPENSMSEEEALKTIGVAFGSFSQASDLDPKLLEHAAVKGMMKSLDPHSAFMSSELYKQMQVLTRRHIESGGIGLGVATIKNRLVVTSSIEGSPADKAGIKPGDYITRINDESTENLSPTETYERLRGPIGSKMNITLERNGEPGPLSFELLRDDVKIESTHSRLIGEKIAYIRLTQFHEGASNDLNRVLQAFRAQGAQALILDLRNNGGGAW